MMYLSSLSSCNLYHLHLFFINSSNYFAARGLVGNIVSYKILYNPSTDLAIFFLLQTKYKQSTCFSTNKRRIIQFLFPDLRSRSASSVTLGMARCYMLPATSSNHTVACKRSRPSVTIDPSLTNIHPPP